uniref:DUF4371 domain-containing protein n=1 Tax=Triticum urartu TaxID=4572 RepID=A0A8R7P617_TRIUA
VPPTRPRTGTRRRHGHLVQAVHKVRASTTGCRTRAASKAPDGLTLSAATNSSLAREVEPPAGQSEHSARIAAHCHAPFQAERIQYWLRYLIAQGEAFRGHDESSTSINKGNFRELLDWYKDKKEDVKEAFDKGPGNAQMICSDIQKDLATACAMEVTKVIKNDIGDKNFSILIDEARDCSIKEQMAVIVRFLDDHGVLQERFLAIKHITDCTSAGIKKALVDVLEYHGLLLRERDI